MWVLGAWCLVLGAWYADGLRSEWVYLKLGMLERSRAGRHGEWVV